MAYERKNVVISAMIGAILAGLIIAGTTLTGILAPYSSIPEGGTPTETEGPDAEEAKLGMLVLMLTDAPSRTLQYLYIQVDEVRLHRVGKNVTTGEGPKLNFPVESRWYNLTALQGNPDILGVGSVPDGNYTMIELHILEAKATFTENLDENVTLTIMANGWVKIPFHFEVEEGVYTVVTLDFDVSQSHISAGNVLRPVIVPKKEG